MSERSTEDLTKDFLKRRIGATARRLRVLADELDAEAERVDRVPTRGTPCQVAIAADVQSKVLWGLANLNLPEIARDAFDADEARREGQAP